ncbi:MAG: GNAT family N-acetyltransferase [Myxococcales bacterium]|nr:GNAT family N-acetyltransferase [Myxococcales bacterium]
METKRLTAADRDLARRMFDLFAQVFEVDNQPLGDAYLDRLLGRDDFWALAALEGDEVIGGLTAHVLPMTRAECFEVFLYDLAVRQDRQRRGVGTALLRALREGAAAAGIEVVFVPADVEDTHALDFYRAVGGEEAEVRIFTWSGPPGAG